MGRKTSCARARKDSVLIPSPRSIDPLAHVGQSGPRSMSCPLKTNWLTTICAFVTAKYLEPIKSNIVVFHCSHLREIVGSGIEAALIWDRQVQTPSSSIMIIMSHRAQEMGATDLLARATNCLRRSVQLLLLHYNQHWQLAGSRPLWRTRISRRSVDGVNWQTSSTHGAYITDLTLEAWHVDG